MGRWCGYNRSCERPGRYDEVISGIRRAWKNDFSPALSRRESANPHFFLLGALSVSGKAMQ